MQTVFVLVKASQICYKSPTIMVGLIHFWFNW